MELRAEILHGGYSIRVRTAAKIWVPPHPTPTGSHLVLLGSAVHLYKGVRGVAPGGGWVVGHHATFLFENIFGILEIQGGGYLRNGGT